MCITSMSSHLSLFHLFVCQITDLIDDPNNPAIVAHTTPGLIITRNLTTIELPPTPIGLPGEETDTAPENEGYEDSVTRCICDLTHDDGYMICCDKCSAWQHVDCMGIDRTNIPDEYNCVVCQPRPVDRLRARSLQLLKRKEQQHFVLLNNPNGLTPAQLAASTPLPIDGLPAHIALAKHQPSIDSAAPAVPADGAIVAADVATVVGSTETATATIGLISDTITNHSSSAAAAIPSSIASNKTGKSKSSGTKQRKSNSATEAASIVTASSTTPTHNSINAATASTNNTTKSARKRNDSATRAPSTSATNGKRRESAKKSSSSANKRRSGKHTTSGASGSMTNATTANETDSSNHDNKTTPAALKQWIENYEQAMTNHYSPDLRARLQAIHKQQASMPPVPLHPHLRNLHHLEAGKCTTVPHAGGKILISMLDLPPQRPIIEVHGKFMLSAQYKPTPGVSAGRLPGPFLFFYRLPSNESGISPTPTSSPSAPITEVCVDTRTFGNDARFVRRSCRPNAEILHTIEKNAIHLYIVSLTQVKSSTEITVRHEPHDLEALSEQKHSQPTSTICACGLSKDCAFTMTGTAEGSPTTPMAVSTKSAMAAKSLIPPVTTSSTLTTQMPESPTKANVAPTLMHIIPQLLQPTPASSQLHQHLSPHRSNGNASVSSASATTTMLMLTGEDSGLAVTPVAPSLTMHNIPSNATNFLNNANALISNKPCYKRTTVSAQTARNRSISNSSSCSSEIAAASGMMSPSHHHQQQHLTYPNPHPFTAPHLLHGDAFVGGGGGGASSSSGAYATSSIGSPPVSMASPSLPSPLAGQVVLINNQLTSPPHVAYHAQQHLHHIHLQNNQQQQPYPALPVTPTRHLDDQSSLPSSSASLKFSHPFQHNHHHQHINPNNQQQQQQQLHQQQIHSTMHAITQQANDLPPATIHLVPALPKTTTPLLAATAVSGSASGFSSTMSPSSNAIGQLSISTSITTATSGATSSPVLPPATLSLVMPLQLKKQPTANHMSPDIDTCDGPATSDLTSTVTAPSSIHLQPVLPAAAMRPATLILNDLCTTETLAESPNPMQMAAGCVALDTPLTPLRSPPRHQQQQCCLVVDTTTLHKTVAVSPRKQFALVTNSNKHINETSFSSESTLTPEASTNDFIPETSATKVIPTQDTYATTTTPSDNNPTTSTTTPVATNSIKESQKLTREERKMQAIMRAFEKMEKNQQRRQELNKSKSSTPTTPLTLLGSPTGSSIPVVSNVCAASQVKVDADDTPMLGSPAKRSSTVGGSSAGGSVGGGGNGGGGAGGSNNSQRKKKRKASKSYQQSAHQRKRVRNRLHSGGDSDGGGSVGAIDSMKLHRSPSGAPTRPLSTTTSSNNNHVHSLHGSHPYASEYGDDNDAEIDAADAGDDDDEHQHHENNRMNVAAADIDNTAEDTAAAAGMLMSLAAHCGVASPTAETPPISTPAKVGSSNALSLISACLLIEAAVAPFDPSQQSPLQQEFKIPPKTKTKKTIMNEWLHQTVGNTDAVSTPPTMQLQQNFDKHPVQLASSTPLSGQSLVAYAQTDIIQPEAPQNLSIAAQRIEEFINISSGHSSPLLHESKWPIMQTPANLLHAVEYTNSTTAIAVPPAAPTPPMQCGSSVKKRWLRQAISEECSDELGGIAGGAGSPPNGYMTPLKKRRMARECSAAAASAALTDSWPVGQQATPRYVDQRLKNYNIFSHQKHAFRFCSYYITQSFMLTFWYIIFS